MRNGGQHPSAIRCGKSTLPIMDPVRPNIIVSETTIVRIDVGNMATTEPTSPVDEMLAIVMYVADSTSTMVELLLQYSSKPQEPDVSRPYTNKFRLPMALIRTVVTR